MPSAALAVLGGQMSLCAVAVRLIDGDVGGAHAPSASLLQPLTILPGVRAIGLRALLVSLQRRGLRRLGQMHHRTDRPQLLHHEPPPRRRLKRDRQLPPSESRNEPPHPGAIRPADPRTADLARVQIDPVCSGLRPMLVYTPSRSTAPQAPFITR